MPSILLLEVTGNACSPRAVIDYSVPLLLLRFYCKYLTIVSNILRGSVKKCVHLESIALSKKY